ncbi:CoA-binding protein [Shigella flexneri]
MSQRGLEALLRPKSIAVIGASMKPNRAGYLMMRNLLAGGFNGPVLPVTPAWKAVLGVLAWPISTACLFPRSRRVVHQCQP